MTGASYQTGGYFRLQWLAAVHLNILGLLNVICFQLMFSCNKYSSVRVKSVSSVDIKAKEVGEELC